MSKDKNYWAVVYRFAWGILFIVLLIGLIFIFLPKCNQVREFQKKKTEYTDQRRTKQEGIQDLKTKQQQFKSDPDFVERVARKNDMIKRDEVIFKFTNKQSKATGVTPR